MAFLQPQTDHFLPSNASKEAPNEMRRTVPELLAPAGNWDCARAAVENGADAIYFGLDRFNARMRSENFTEADLPLLMEFLHKRGVKGYVTLNTLIFPSELEDARQYLKSVITAGVDAAIVQDVGLCTLIRQMSPDFPIHASTQMTITSAAGVEFAADLGCQLVVLARECSIQEINKIRSATQATCGMPLEVFVHGALCVAYSGQCLTSESLGGRSANRGECAQACRMPYELICDGEKVDLGDRQYLLSPQDLSGLAVLPELIRSGVTCLKIEGRLKAPEYVANVTKVYRQALDRAIESAVSDSHQTVDQTDDQTVGDPDVKSNANRVSQSDRYDLEMAFSRGLYPGWFNGINNQELAHARYGKKRGVYLGQVLGIEPDRFNNPQIILKAIAAMKPGDGVVFDAGKPDQREEGGRIYTVETRRGETYLTFGQDVLNIPNINIGDRIWKTSDPELDKRVRQTYDHENSFQRPVDIEIHGGVGEVLTAILRDRLGHIVQVESTMPCIEAHHKPIDTDKLRDQFGRLGGTPFELGELVNHATGLIMLPVSEMNRMRRESIEKLMVARSQPKWWTLTETSPIAPLLKDKAVQSSKSLKKDTAELIVLVRNLEQLEVAIESGVETIYAEFEDPRRYGEAVIKVRAAAHRPQILVVPPRITKMGEHWILEQVLKSDSDGYLVRNYDQLKFFQSSENVSLKNIKLVGDFSLNVANALTAEYFKTHYPIDRLTASYDLNIRQLTGLLNSTPSEWLEITLHQHMPMFHMEHCVFCAFLSTGTDFTNCGRPCDTHEVKLRDRTGTEHLLKADAGCRNTVFNGVAQTGAEQAQKLMDLGAKYFRIEFANETPSQVRQTIRRYQQLLAGEITGADLWRSLQNDSPLQNQLGVTRGTLEV